MCNLINRHTHTHTRTHTQSTGVETPGRTQDGNGDRSGDGNESNSGDGNGNEVGDGNGNRSEDRVVEGGGEAKKRNKPHNTRVVDAM